MTAQEGYFGSDEQKNRFKPIDGSDEAYFLQIKSDEPGKGDIQVWNEEFGSDKNVGTYKKQEDGTYKFEPNKNWWGGAQGKEVKYFGSPEGMKRTIEKGNQTVVQEKKDSCTQSGGQNCDAVAQEEADKITKTEEQIKAEAAAKNEEGLSDDERKDLNEDVGREDYGGDMIYPLDRHDTQDYMLFEVLKYTPRGLKNSDNSGGPLKSRANKTDKGERKILATISLPIPANIQDTNVVDWQKDDIDELSKQMASLTSSAIEGNVSEGIKEVENNVKKPGSVKAITAGLKNTITGVKAMQREKGAVFNENTELLFNGPGMRSFSFSFRLSPRSADEAKMVRRIIRAFKESMSAKKSKEFFFIKAPNTYWISYMSGITNELHPWLNKIKECALSNMSVQYAPDGSYATFPDGSMTSYLMQLSFKEIEPVFNTDYEEGEKDEIGY